MYDLQATWLPGRRVLFWSAANPTDQTERAVAEELPSIAERGHVAHHTLAAPGAPGKRQKVRGIEVGIEAALPALSRIGRDARVSESVQAWSLACKLALELAARQRVVPTVQQGEARWIALLSREEDRQRIDAIAASMPVAAHAVPSSDRGSVMVSAPRIAVRSFVDAAVDCLYRQNAHPGPTRGWGLELATALRGEQPAFTPRDARNQGVPQMVAAWSSSTEAGGLRVGFHLQAPAADSPEFVLSVALHDAEDHTLWTKAEDAWRAGGQLIMGGRVHAAPARTLLKGLARAWAIYPPLRAVVAGRAAPGSITWKTDEAWAFLSGACERLRDAGYVVHLPETFEGSEHQRMRARLHIETETDPIGTELLAHWEVVFGDVVVDGTDFAALLEQKQPILQFRGQWVVLDPKELARLPQNLHAETKMPAPEGLRAVLVGDHEGAQVVPGPRLKGILDTLKEPPEVAVPAGFRGTLRPYQMRGLAWLTAMGRLGLGCCLADDMGLGKTVQLIAHLLARGRGRPSLVVCPTSVIGNWAREIARFAPTLRVGRYHGFDRDDSVIDKSDVILTTYGVLVRDSALFEFTKWGVVALDEAQAIKNPTSRRAQSVRKLTVAHRIALTGTPVENRLDELWALMSFLVPGLLGSRQRFQRDFAVPVERFGDDAVARRLRATVAPFLLRRLKNDPTIVPDLPDKIERRDYVPLTREQADLYQETVDDYMQRIRGSTDIARRGLVLAMLTKLKQVCNHPSQLLGEKGGTLDGRSGKLARLEELVETLLDSDQRALIFTQYKEMGSLLARHLRDTFDVEVAFYHGGTPTRQRESMVKAFQEDPNGPRLLIVSLKAGGTGLNLTAATQVIHYDRWWNPAVEDQATDRAYRIGQRKNVLVHKLITQETLEERIDAMMEEKRALAGSVVGAGEHWITEFDDDSLARLVALGGDAVLDENLGENEE